MLKTNYYAGIAQLIERFLAKEEARSLSLLTRTNEKTGHRAGFFIGPVQGDKFVASSNQKIGHEFLHRKPTGCDA